MANYHQPEKITDCCLCNEIETGIFPAEYAAVYGVDKRICFESDNFIVIPSVSPLAIGHTMLLPKQHYTSIMACPKEMKDEALTLIDSLYANLSDRFGQLFLFEHGVGRLDDVACGINHAHLHFVPLPENISNGIIEKVIQQLGTTGVTTLNDLYNAKYHADAYIMMGNRFNSMQKIVSDHIPSQLVRKLIAGRLNNKTWDWRNADGISQFTDSLTALLAMRQLTICV